MDVSAPNSAAIPPAVAVTNYIQAQILESQSKRTWEAVQIFFVWGAVSIAVGVKYGLLPALGCVALTAFLLFRIYQSHQEDIEKTSSPYQLVKALLDKNPIVAQEFLDRWVTLTHEKTDPNGQKHLESAFRLAAAEGYDELAKRVGLRLWLNSSDPKQTWLEDELRFAVAKKNVVLTLFLLDGWNFTDPNIIGTEFSSAARTNQKDLIDPFLKKYSQIIPPKIVLESMKKMPDPLAIEIFQEVSPHHPIDLDFGKHSNLTWGFFTHCCLENRVDLMKHLITHRHLSPDAALHVYFLLDRSMSAEMTNCLQDKIKEDGLYDTILTAAESGPHRLSVQGLEKLRKRKAELT